MPDSAALSRLPAGLILAIIVASAAHVRGSLSRGGAAAAVIVALGATAAGWSWAFLLIFFFVSSTLLSRAGASKKRAATADVVEKGGNRDAWQVFANGGVFAGLAILFSATADPVYQAAAAGALAASTADTWATELGTLSNRQPRDMITGRPVTAGTSGGVTWIGTIAGFAGAAFIAVVALLFDWPIPAGCAAITGGIAGSIIDSLLGATLQEKRWCPMCERGTERAIHSCGTVTVKSGGLSWLRNDLVNFFSSIAGAIVGSLCLL